MSTYINHAKSVVGLKAIGKMNSVDPTDNVKKGQVITITDEYHEDGDGWMITYLCKGKVKHSPKCMWDIQYTEDYYISED